jgi:acyl-CoA thioester hydrolase
VTYEVAVFSTDSLDEGPVAVGSFTHVFVNSKTRKPVPLEIHMRERLLKLQIDDGVRPSQGKL